MMVLDELINQTLNAQSIEELVRTKAELVKLMAKLASQYAASLTDYAQALSSIKETYFEMTVTEARKKAGEQTGYRYKEIPGLMDAVGEAISLVDDRILSLRMANQECQN